MKRTVSPLVFAGMVALSSVLMASGAMATEITGSQNLLSGAHADLLEAHLGEGELAFTNIFTKAPGNTTVDFHNAVDGEGRTFMIVEVLVGNGNNLLIGGYNPRSWNSFEGWHYSPTDEERTAFIYNLTTNDFQDQKPSHFESNNPGQHQTYNSLDRGPSFGGGHDLYVAASLNSGSNLASSYGDEGNPYSRALTGISGSFTIGQIEIFTIAAENSQPVPVLEALVDIDPDKINLKSHGQWVTVYIELPEGFEPGLIDVDTIAIVGLIGNSCDPNYIQASDLSFTPQIGDHDEDGIADLTVKFDRQLLQASLCQDDVEIRIEGNLTTGEPFGGVDSIRVK
jgi:hypothetical protein